MISNVRLNTVNNITNLYILCATLLNRFKFPAQYNMIDKLNIVKQYDCRANRKLCEHIKRSIINSVKKILYSLKAALEVFLV